MIATYVIFDTNFAVEEHRIIRSVMQASFAANIHLRRYVHHDEAMHDLFDQVVGAGCQIDPYPAIYYPHYTHSLSILTLPLTSGGVVDLYFLVEWEHDYMDRLIDGHAHPVPSLITTVTGLLPEESTRYCEQIARYARINSSDKQHLN